MRDIKINLSIIHFSTLLECSINKNVNEHGKVVISGYVEDMDEDELLYRNSSYQFAKIEIKGEQQDNVILFEGLIESIKIQHTGGLKKVNVTLTGGTRLLEGVERVRTFQDASMTYSQLLESIDHNYNNIMHIMREDEKLIGDLIVQYKETDWEFLKRIASHYNSIIIPYYKSSGIRYHLGLEKNKYVKNLDHADYSITNDVNEFYLKSDGNVEGLMRQDVLCYEIETREVFELGDGIMLSGIPLYIYAVNSRLKGGELVHIYKLKTEGGFKVPKQYNYKIIGASLDASILSVAKDTVKVCVSADGKQEEAIAKWFPYSTVYSSPDGTGWYCMPEKGDSVRLYFPDEKEHKAYVISSINIGSEVSALSSATAPPRSNPDNKSISTKYNKKIELTPDSITITNNKGMTVKLDDNEGISIISDKDVIIQSDENLMLKSLNQGLSITAAKSIQLIQGNTKMTLKDDVIVEGAKFLIE